MALLVHYRETMGISFFAEALDLIRYKIAQGCKTIGANIGVAVEVEAGSRLRIASADDLKRLTRSVRKSAFGGMPSERVEEIQQEIDVELGLQKEIVPKRPPIVDRHCLMVSVFCCAIVFGLPLVLYILAFRWVQADGLVSSPVDPPALL